MLINPSSCWARALRDKLEAMVCLELTGGSFMEDEASEEPRFLFSLSSVFFIGIDYRLLSLN